MCQRQIVSMQGVRKRNYCNCANLVCLNRGVHSRHGSPKRPPLGIIPWPRMNRGIPSTAASEPKMHLILNERKGLLTTTIYLGPGELGVHGSSSTRLHRNRKTKVMRIGVDAPKARKNFMIGPRLRKQPEQ